MIRWCHCNLYVGVKCVSARIGTFLCEFTHLRRLERETFLWQAAKKHGSCLKVLVGLECISDQGINEQKLSKVH